MTHNIHISSLQLRHTTQYYGSIQEELKGNLTTQELQSIQDALDFIIKKNNKYGKQNESLALKEVVNTAIIVIKEIKLDIDSGIAALLYKITLNNFCTLEEISQQFHPGVSAIVNELCIGHNTMLDRHSINLYKYDLYLDKSRTKAVLIKLANHFYIMQKLASSNAKIHYLIKSINIAIDFYIPLAHRLRLYYIQGGLEDICFRFKYPLKYYAVASKLKESQISRKAAVKKFSGIIHAKLKEYGITCQIKARAKSIYSIWRKQTKLRMRFDDIHDLLAVRIIIVKEMQNFEEECITCWQVYHIITNLYPANISKMRDWISVPKKNGYTALHATIINKEKRVVEVQIRTQQMDELAESGNAAHWKYKAT